ncbi:MAG: hypothetical protein A2086_00455 [Spirochaetes bacterium GWD1_27_9]|nr:MAG: hypothetical protein A2Z98_08645 [Spirochaetes bacterium GWB1_27_13]OHD22163.1 MAG: hypothetical protein A2Y34_15990 [Spirochaetes bacterium GWC1_27_15]OHD37253.1 MAG: hypothetical protein A2086_00455 [Spirochaetes bacterium GWD1_27_9]
MKKFIGLIIFLLIASFSYANDPATILDEWFMEKGNSLVKFYVKDGKYFAKMIWSKKEGNFNGQKDVVLDLVFEKDEWKKGKMLDPHHNKIFYCKIKMKNQNELDVRC